MYKYLVSIFIICILLSGSAFGEEQKKIGLGLIIGEPSGISAKYWFSGNGAIDAALSWSFINNGLYIHADYMRHMDIVKRLKFYYGLGIALSSLNQGGVSGIDIAGRIPLGLTYLFNAPFDAFIEVVPLANLIPAFTIGFNLGIGGRYYF